MVAYVVAIVFFAFIFDFSNGFHDSANSIATIVGTRVLSPIAAVVWGPTLFGSVSVNVPPVGAPVSRTVWTASAA